MDKKLNEYLTELGFKPSEIKVYVASTQLGEASATQIAKKISLPRTTVISILQRLEEDNYISTHRYKGKTYFWVESPRLIKDSLEQKMKVASNLEEILTELYRSESNFPFSKTFDTKTSIKKYIEKTLLETAKKSTIYTIDNPNVGNYRKIFSDDYGRILVDIKKSRQIMTKTLIPNGTKRKIDPKKLTTQEIKIRELPEGIEFPASLWIMKKKIVFFSGKLPFLVEINHPLIRESIWSLYQFLWQNK
jgi:sugar-specific transcriptional regulator TrmB